MAELSKGQRVIMRAMNLMKNGKAYGWSHAIELAAQTFEPLPEKPQRRTKKARTQ